MQHKVANILLGIIVLGGAVLVYFHFLDGTTFNPVSDSLTSRVYQTVKDSYNIGDDVLVYSKGFCKLRSVPTTVYWELEDDVLLPYPPKNAFFPKGCYGPDKLIEVEVLPGFIGNHKYHFVGKVVYHLVARDVTTALSTNDFYVNAGSAPKK